METIVAAIGIMSLIVGGIVVAENFYFNKAHREKPKRKEKRKFKNEDILDLDDLRLWPDEMYYDEVFENQTSFERVPKSTYPYKFWPDGGHSIRLHDLPPQMTTQEFAESAINLFDPEIKGRRNMQEAIANGWTISSDDSYSYIHNHLGIIQAKITKVPGKTPMEQIVLWFAHGWEDFYM